MWIKTENSEPTKPKTIEVFKNRVILNRNFHLIEASEEKPEHWEYETWEMSMDQYEVYQYMKNQMQDQSDALIELAEMIVEIGG